MIRVLPLKLTFEAESTLRLPDYPGALWRSAFGARLRRDACITGAASCDGCAVRQRCAYGAVFEPAPTSRSLGLLQQFQDLPRPYVISPRHRGGEYGAGHRLPLDLILTESALPHFKAAETAFSRLELHGTCMRIIDVAVCPPTEDTQPAATTAAGSTGYPIDAPPAPGTARIVLEHPLRLRQDKREVDASRFTVAVFVSSLLRRISSLHDATAAAPMQANYRALIHHASERVHLTDVRLSWVHAERRSARQQRRVPMGGLIGCFTIEGDLEPLWPWLWAGQWAHVGKGAVMGLGRYRIDHFDR
ncbi:CRISPR system precrRNA processing endoribonuclease RAMP protein Cas6 [Arhodomonas sp. AD133]|uniref:CRISPR system precrRNA processing endoribonuclease RAMP protein Cas6 n=1 Tax=Arhodomonas sp. AD133 TaxID=3415009 RepID=UPI003EBAE021